MFGYVVPDKPNMFMKDYYEFRAYYCGLCKAIGKRQGQLLRFTLSYDMTFLAVFLHAVMGTQPKISRERCVCHPIRSREMVARDDIMLSVSDVGAVLTYYKAKDSAVDAGGAAKILPYFVRRKKNRAAKRLSGVEEAVRLGYDELRVLEGENSPEIERVADCFARLLQGVVKPLLGDKATEHTDKFAYQLGKWIYLADALDDYDKDVKKGNYNPFVAAYKAVDKKELIEKHGQEVSDLFWFTLASLKESYDKIELLASEGVLTNTVYYGLPMMTNRILRSEKCTKIRL